MAGAGMTLGGLVMLAGAVGGGELGPMAAGYGFVLVIAAAYLVAALAIRDRVWRRLKAGHLPRAHRGDRLHGRHIF